MGKRNLKWEKGRREELRKEDGRGEEGEGEDESDVFSKRIILLFIHQQQEQ